MQRSKCFPEMSNTSVGAPHVPLQQNMPVAIALKATFKFLWDIVYCWRCDFYLTDGWKLYPCFIDSQDHICKTYMTRDEGENTRLRHYLARLPRKTLCYSKTVDILKYSIGLILHDFKYREVPVLTGS